ncbi:aminomethyl-transferring glycine dehydrogenase subunit GcvPA [Tautonia sociabilis]|uniref:Probable glycine dehydrogenase (decarboxylating) subunit 1 n=1 Tax=Tautonia sociabilis TaxID=2080755 RepID=A0A432MQD0_9BACT|nr:aminomethyl-transferring glycine dehydrogenase subunit GcvPA [Tautonia sociabilis]RUL89208.1 aminomethyl-transferring glycine dehydrogenase subunit GcvPA [Tautonia sociabilis]
MAYILNTDDDTREMLRAIGLDSLDQLFDMVPADFRLDRPLDVPPALTEIELTRHVGALAARNASVEDRPCFLGGGAYDHFIPAAVDQLAARGEFYTAYTPYQAEASQGTLQAIFEYQTLIAQLTGMDVSNASLYDGGSAVAEGILMALASGSRHGRVVASGAVHPEYRQVAETFLTNLEPELVTVPCRNGRTSVDDLTAALTDDTAAVVLQQPNVFGQLEDIEPLVAAAQDRGATVIVSVDPIGLGLLKRPGDFGADIVTAEGQALGNHLCFGGPYLGILCCRESYLRKIPGRLVGQTTDREGRRCFVLTLQTREQHIRREKATSNICTNQGLMALRASIYLALMGPLGLRDVAEQSARKAHYAADRLAEVPGLSLAFDGPFFKEFVVRVAGGKDPARVLAEVGRLGFHGGIAIGRWYPELADCILIAVTEKRTRAEIDALADAYRAALSSS